MYNREKPKTEPDELVFRVATAVGFGQQMTAAAPEDSHLVTPSINLKLPRGGLHTDQQPTDQGEKGLQAATPGTEYKPLKKMYY